MENFDLSQQPFDFERELRERARRAGNWENLLNQYAEMWGLSGELGKSAVGPEGPQLDTGPLSELYFSGSHLIREFDREASAFEQLLSGIGVNSTGYVATFTSNFLTVVPPISITPKEQQLLGRLQETVSRDLKDKRVEEQLKRIDPTLVPVYQQAIRQLYTSGPDALRTALAQVRQLWDHLLFDRLSPTDAVVAEFGKAERSDRLNFILRHKVMTPFKRENLQLTKKSDEDSYDELNYLHKRGLLREEVARSRVLRALTVLVRWLDAVS